MLEQTLQQVLEQPLTAGSPSTSQQQDGVKTEEQKSSDKKEVQHPHSMQTHNKVLFSASVQTLPDHESASQSLRRSDCKSIMQCL